MNSNPPESVQIFVRTPNHWKWPDELIWARKIEEELYEVLSIPYAAYGLNKGDRVITQFSNEKQLPEIISVSSPSPHRTVRVIFTNQSVPIEERDNLFKNLKNDLMIEFEKVNDNYYVLDAPESDSHEKLCELLARLQTGEILAYETCEPRIEGSFGDEQSSVENQGPLL